MANGFGNSFEKAFSIGQQKGSDAALATIKERIKKQETKATEELKSLQAQKDFEKVRSFVSKKNPELAADLATLDVEDMGTETLININKMLSKQLVPPTENEQLIDAGKVANALTQLREAGMIGAGGGVSMPSSAPQASVDSTAQVANAVAQQGGTATAGQPAPSGDLVPTDFNVAGVATKYKSKSGMAAEEQSKVDAKNRDRTQKAENTSVGTFRFMQQFQKSYDELKAFDPTVDEEGVGGWMSRQGAKIAEHLDELPETKALKIQSLPMANGMAREIEGGRVTDSDRKIYADSLASALNFPTKTNVRNMSTQIIGLIDKGGNENGKITNQLKEFAKSESDIFKSVIAQVLMEYPEMAKDIYGEDYEVVDED